MYKQFFGLNENPFNVNPDPRYLYLTGQTQEALDVLTYGIEARKGLMLLTGEVGTGKTTLLNRLLDWLHQQQTPTAFIFNPHLGTSHLLDFILGDFEVPTDTRLKTNPLMRLNLWLIERYRAGHTPVLIVDEAQGLPIPALEEIRMLLNLEAPHEKLLQIVLAGQPEIEERLKRPELRQLAQRIMIRCKTVALTLEETHDYIRARLHIAGANGKPVFTSQAMDSVHFYSQGIPRITNLLCEHALINAYVDQVQPVPAHIIGEIAREFLLDDVTPLSPTMAPKDPICPTLIASQPVPANALAFSPPETAPRVQEKPEIEACVSSPHVFADTLLSQANELATSVLDCESTMELPANPVPISFSALLDGVIVNEVLDLPLVSSHGPVDPPKAAQPPISVNATVSTPANSRRMRHPGQRLPLAHHRTMWGRYFLPAVNSPIWGQVISRLLAGLNRLLQSAGALRRWPLNHRDRYKSVIGSIQWARMFALLYDWLRQPFDPVQLWRVPYSWLFKGRRRLSQTCK